MNILRIVHGLLIVLLSIVKICENERSLALRLSLPLTGSLVLLALTSDLDLLALAGVLALLALAGVLALLALAGS